ncbi:MAG: indolepyruvate oxidoreductase subunit beta [Actinobacteria bacterium]|nr:indolepyruvate oxidoreductase subunit beta [Actinomycetota bacterium]
MGVETKNILIVGVGGQGIISATDILAQVLVSTEYDVKVSEAHGMSQGGGSVNTMVRFGNKVYSPVIEKGQADYMLAFEKLEALRWSNFLKPGSTVIMNDEIIKPLPVLLGKAKYPDDIEERIRRRVTNLVTIDAGNLAESVGSRRAANIVLLACLATFMPVPKDVWYACIERRVPPKAVEVSKSAFDMGYEFL